MSRRHGGSGADLGPCPLCGRPMLAGPSLERHHWLPRSLGGREASWLHAICHRHLHRLFSRAELAALYATPQAAREHPDMERFLRWVRRQPAEYFDWPEPPGRHGRK